MNQFLAQKQAPPNFIAWKHELVRGNEEHIMVFPSYILAPAQPWELPTCVSLQNNEEKLHLLLYNCRLCLAFDAKRIRLHYHVETDVDVHVFGCSIYLYVPNEPSDQFFDPVDVLYTTWYPFLAR